MKAKEYLDEIFILNTKINAKQKELDKLNDLLIVLNKPLTPDKVQTSKDQDPIGSAISKIVDLQREINKMIDDYVDRLQEACAIIECIDNPKEYDLLHKHYILGMSWSHIADTWDTSNVWVHEVKRSAFDSVQKILDKMQL